MNFGGRCALECCAYHGAADPATTAPAATGSGCPGMKRDLIVVTDLDGTLLDHHSYSFAAAADAMARLRELDIPLILNTSKTRMELQQLRRELHNPHPFIVENGSAVFLPPQYFSPSPEDTEIVSAMACRVFGCHYAQLLQQLQPLRQQYRFTGFSDLSVARLSELTGLDAGRAQQALAREFSEPLLWRDSDAALAIFRKDIAAIGLTTLQGGRFLHVLGQADKGRSLEWLRRLYAGQNQRQPCVIALGDSGNDIAMLQAADVGVVIRSPNHPPPSFSSQHRVIVSDKHGPQGWSDTIYQLLEEFA
jgi:mannosyl-3-phosphoglycerate phosphatase